MVLAACDEELFGKHLASEDMTLDLGSEFYNGDRVTDDEFRGMLAQATSANLMGPRTVELAIQMEMVHPDAVMDVCGVRHAMFFTV